jgi:hypothetical protein
MRVYPVISIWTQPRHGDYRFHIHAGTKQFFGHFQLAINFTLLTIK